MNWKKIGQICDWHASYPVVDKLEDRLRIYYAQKINERSHIFYLDVEIDNPLKIIHSEKEPLIYPGKEGTFDCDGVVPRCITNANKEKRLYVIGVSKKVTTPYQLAVGVCFNQDKWEKQPGPVLNSDFDDPYFCTSPSVMFHDNRWKTWYCSCTNWIDGKEPVYLIKYAESDDGLHWNKTNKICINYDDFTHAIGWPTVWIEENIFKMIYSFRTAFVDYRTNPEHSYRFGYAESFNGLDWTRKDHEVGISVSKEGWDSKMIAYSAIFDDNLIYNGNGFGETGIGLAKRIS